MNIHPSQLAKWSQCERYALDEATTGSKNHVPHIASWVGTAAHKLIAGEDAPEPLRLVRFDAITPSFEKAEKQALSIYRNFTRVARWKGWKVEHSELAVDALVGRTMVTGTVDVIVRIPGHLRTLRALLDLKTGRDAPHGWIQLGAYALALDAAAVPIDDLGLIAIRRQDLDESRFEEDPEKLSRSVQLRPALGIMEDVKAQLERVTEVYQGEQDALARPGLHCSYCNVSGCLLRYSPTRKGKRR